MSTAEEITYPTQQELIGEPAAVAESQSDDDQVDEQEAEPRSKRERWAEFEPTDEETRAPRRRHRWDLLGGSFTIGDENSTVERLRCRRCGLQARRVPTRTGGSLRLEVLPDGATEWTPELAPCPGDSDGRFSDDVASPRAITDVHPLFAKTVELEHRVDQLLAELASLRSVPAPVPIPAPAAGRRPLPSERPSITHKFRVDGQKGYFTVGLYPDTKLPGEVFVVMGQHGSQLSGLVDAWSKACSDALQYGQPVEELVARHSHSRFPPEGFTESEEIRYANSVCDYVVRWIGMKFCPAAEAEQPLGAQP